jgi:hypothetical protein
VCLLNVVAVRQMSGAARVALRRGARATLAAEGFSCESESAILRRWTISRTISTSAAASPTLLAQTSLKCFQLRSPNEHAERLEVGVYLTAWRSQHPGVNAEIVE